MPSVEQIKGMLALEPGDAFLRYALAMELAKRGEHEGAMVEFRTLVGQSPDYVAGYFMGGRTCEQMGEVEEAKKWYRDGIAAANRVGDAHAAGEIAGALMAIE
jgi:predicted Zn-dependent protease